jgi:hypothetical protein
MRVFIGSRAPLCQKLMASIVHTRLRRRNENSGALNRARTTAGRPDTLTRSDEELEIPLHRVLVRLSLHLWLSR